MSLPANPLQPQSGMGCIRLSMNRLLPVVLLLALAVPAQACMVTTPLIEYLVLGSFLHLWPALLAIGVGLVRLLIGRGSRVLRFGIAWLAWTAATAVVAAIWEFVHWNASGSHQAAAFVEYGALTLSIALGPVVSWVQPRSKPVARAQAEGLSLRAAGRCPVCAEGMGARLAVLCRKCSTPHHEACLQFNGRCGIYGCEPDRDPRAAAAAQELEKDKGAAC